MHMQEQQQAISRPGDVVGADWLHELLARGPQARSHTSSRWGDDPLIDLPELPWERKVLPPVQDWDRHKVY